MTRYRKLLLGVAALALTASTGTGLVGVTSASASGANGPTITCTFSSEWTFPAPGMSVTGSLGPSRVNQVSIATSTSPSCTDGTNTFSAVVNAVTVPTRASAKCKGKAGDPAPCDGLANDKGMYVYDQQNIMLQRKAYMKAFKHNPIDIAPYGLFAIKPTQALVTEGTFGCAGFGFMVMGAIKAPKTPDNYKGGSMSMEFCFAGDSGPGTTDNFSSDIATATIATATAAATATFTS